MYFIDFPPPATERSTSTGSPRLAAGVVGSRVAPEKATLGARAHESAPGRAGIAMSRKGTILVVDDEPGVREVLEEYLAAHGYAAIGAESAAAARKLVAKEPVDLALIDIHMPGEDGLTLARHLRERHPGIAIVMLTSATAVVDRIVGLEMGADDYVPKPFDPRELLARVRSVLRRLEARTQGPRDAAAVPAAARAPFGRCLLDIGSRQLFDAAGVEVPITAMEFELNKVPSRLLVTLVLL